MSRNAMLIVAITTIMIMGLGSPPVGAQDFPSRTVRVVSAFPPGGGTDAIARHISESMSVLLKQPFVVENRSGAGGGLAAINVKNSNPDGYTILQTISGTLSVEPALGKVQYSFQDFTYLGAVVQFQEAIVAKADVPWPNLGKLLQSPAAKNGQITMGTQGQLDQLIIDAINKKSSNAIVVVPFRGGPDVIQAILGGHVTMGWSGTLHVPLIERGEMKPLAVAGTERYARYPDTPTLIELGFPLSLNMYSIFAVPAGTPAPIVEILSKALLQAAQEPSFVSLCQKYNFVPRAIGSKETTALVERQFQQASAAVQNAR